LNFKGTSGTQKGHITMLTPVFPHAIAEKKNKKGWGIRRIGISVDLMGEKQIHGRFRWITVLGNKIVTEWGKLSADEIWSTIGADAEHAFMDIKPFTQWTNVLPEEPFRHLLEDWSDTNYASLWVALNITSTGVNVSTSEFITVDVMFEAYGPKANL